MKVVMKVMDVACLVVLGLALLLVICLVLGLIAAWWEQRKK